MGFFFYIKQFCAKELTSYFPAEHTCCPHAVGRFKSKIMYDEISPRKFVTICRII